MINREKATEQIGFRVTPSFKERLETQAVEEDRTVANLIVKAMNDYLNKIDEAKKTLNQK
jgi:predicted DNA-binding protein